MLLNLMASRGKSCFDWEAIAELAWCGLYKLLQSDAGWLRSLSRCSLISLTHLQCIFWTPKTTPLNSINSLTKVDRWQTVSVGFLSPFCWLVWRSQLTTSACRPGPWLVSKEQFRLQKFGRAEVFCNCFMVYCAQFFVHGPCVWRRAERQVN